MRVSPARCCVLLTSCAVFLSCASGVLAVQTTDLPGDFVSETRIECAMTDPADSPVALVLSTPDWRSRIRLQALHGEAPTRAAHVLLDDFSFQSLYLATRVRPGLTRWAEPWDKESIVTAMNRILAQSGIEAAHVRVRMIAHAVVASGWRQNVWNHNAWGVQRGSWQGSWYEMPTFEEDETGNRYRVPDAAWRSFSSWDEAISDFVERISPRSDRPAYRQAFFYLNDPSCRPSVDAAYWQSLGQANYYTDSAFTPKHYARLCHFVRQILSGESTPDNAVPDITVPDTAPSHIFVAAR